MIAPWRRRIPAATFVAFHLATGVIGAAFAQTTPPPTKESPNTTGRTTIPEKKEPGQPRGDQTPAAPESGKKNN
jgi:hypothetical protein